MTQSVPAFMQALADAFLVGDHDWLADVYTYPLAVYLDGEILIETTAEDTLHTLFARRASALSAGTKRIEARVIDFVETADRRFPVRVDWHFINAEGDCFATNELRYYCRFAPDGTIRIEILEFISRGIATLPSSQGKFIPKH